MTLVTLLLRMLVAEVGLAQARDHAAMLPAIDRLAAGAGLTVEEAVAIHVSEFARGFPPSRAWIPQLTTACERPAAWPKRLDWEGAHQHLCFAAVARVRAHLAGKLPDPCKGKPNQWRARGKAARAALRKGWPQIGCGPTVQVYFRRG